MHNDLTNLLPQERQSALSRDYFLRLSVVAAGFLTALMVIASALLIPAYLLLVGNMKANEARLANVESRLSSSNETALSNRLTALSSDAAILTALANAPSASAIMRMLLAVPRPGVTLANLVYTPVLGGVPGTLSISGTAATRDVLRRYQLALQNTPGIHSADLPVSAYAQDTNISFTIMVTLAP